MPTGGIRLVIIVNNYTEIARALPLGHGLSLGALDGLGLLWGGNRDVNSTGLTLASLIPSLPILSLLVLPPSGHCWASMTPLTTTGFADLLCA